MKRILAFTLSGLAVVALVVGGVVFGPALAQNVSCYFQQGGDAVNFDSGCTWSLDGTSVTATGAELNILDGVTATESELDASSDQSAWAVLDPSADDSLTLAEHGGYPSKAILMSSADGDTFTLPAASGTGAVYTVVVSTTVTSNNHVIQVANATDEFYGTIYQIDTDSSDAIAAYPSLDADGFDTITMDGSTQCGLKGDTFKFTDIAAGQWQVEGTCSATGSVGSPLSAGVS